MDISVIVPVYNSGAYVKRCCEALTAQEYPRDRFEVLLVDNGSSDDSAEIISGYSRIQLLFEQEKSSYAARNCGLRRARGEIIAFTDSDCAPRPDWLARIVSAMQDVQVQIVLGDRQYASEKGLMGMLANYESRMAACTFTGSRPERYYAYTNNMAFRNTVFDRVGYFDQVQRGGDNLLLRRALTALGGCAIVRYDPDVVVRHLEIENASDYLKKKTTYGNVRAANRDRGAPEPLPVLTRLDMARKSMAGKPASDALRFCAVLAAGMIGFEWAARGMFRRARKRIR